MTTTLQAVRGMNDVLPDDTPLWAHFEAVTRDWLAAYGYREIRLPMLERTELFVRSIGEVTDIVEKEMYTFVDSLNGESLTLRPEGTASCVRAAVEHHLLYNGPQRLWYAGPMFRHERPQKGRYRQFHQVGVEALGYAGPDVDAEHIIMAARLWERLGLTGIRLELNSLGDAAARARHREKLIRYLEARREALDEDGRRRLHANPLRVLDSKNPALAELIKAAPTLADELDDEAAAHFESVRARLDASGIAYQLNPRLVRGLDYYNRTVFEWVTNRLGAQGTVCAGGRYDGLIAQLGGKPQPACGFALGVERVLALLVDAERPLPWGAPHAYVAHQGEEGARFAWEAADVLRTAGLRAVLHCGGGNFKAQLKKADASGALYAVIVGDEEARERRLTLKPLREEGPQERLAVADAVQRLAGAARTTPHME